MSSNYTTQWGPGKEVYGQILDAFNEAFGEPLPGRSMYYRSPTQWLEFMKMDGAMARGIVPLVRKYGADKTKWDEVPEELPIFGPFTGSQHELGGNPFVALAAQVAGWDVTTLELWLLEGRARLSPDLFDPNIPGSYAYRAAHPQG